MPHSSETGMRNTELEEYEYEQYTKLKQGNLKVKVSKSAYRCPFCPEKKNHDYLFKELLRHAYGVSSSKNRGARERVRHLALEKYMKKYLTVKEQSKPTTKYETESPKIDDHGKGTTNTYRMVMEQSKPATRNENPKVDDHGQDQLFVFPWVGIVANIKTQLKDGRYVGESGSKLRDEFISKGFNPLRVHPLWNHKGHSGFAVVEFNKDFVGFNNAIMFEKSFEVGCHGKKDFYGKRNLGDELYGWVAREDDFHSKSLIGDHLRKNGDLRTVSGIEAEDQRNTEKLKTKLTHTLEMNNKRLNEMNNKYTETVTSHNMLMEQMDQMTKSYNEDIRQMQQNERDQFEKVFLDRQKVALHFEHKKKHLQEREKLLQRREAQNETEMKKLHYDKRMHERATLEQKKVDENVMRLVEDQKKEQEELRRKIIDLEKQLDAKQALELEIQRLRGVLQVMKHMGEDEDTEVKKKMDVIHEELKDKEEELDGLEDLNQTLIVKERKTNDEVQDARKELINTLREGSTRAFIRVKPMGDLDSKAFIIATKRKFPGDEAEEKALELCSLWEDHIRDPSWHPFKIVEDKEGNCKEVINLEDEKLKTLKEEYGDDVLSSVTTALSEMNQYNPSGRYMVPELWNFQENRKASLKEGVSRMLKQWKLSKRKSK